MSAIKFNYNGTDYKLEFDRDTAALAERRFGIGMTDITDMHITSFPLLFHAALLKHHPNIKPDTVQMLFEKLGGRVELFAALCTMYGECIMTLMEEPDEGNGLSWETI